MFFSTRMPLRWRIKCFRFSKSKTLVTRTTIFGLEFFFSKGGVEYKYLFKNRHESEIEVSWVYQSCQSINENYWARTLWGKRTEGRKMTMETQHRENDRAASVCSRERYNQTCSHPKRETALRDADAPAEVQRPEGAESQVLSCAHFPFLVSLAGSTCWEAPSVYTGLSRA